MRRVPRQITSAPGGPSPGLFRRIDVLNNLLHRLSFRFAEHNVARKIGTLTAQKCYKNSSPRDHLVEHQGTQQTILRFQLNFFDSASSFEDTKKHFDRPANNVLVTDAYAKPVAADHHSLVPFDLW